MSGAYFIGEESPARLRQFAVSAHERATRLQEQNAELDRRNAELRRENERLQAELLAAKGMPAGQDWTGSEESRSLWMGPG